MSPFQRAREEALLLRKKLLGEQTGLPLPAKDLLNKIESEVGLGLEYLEDEASELGNGDACLNRQERFIYVKKGLLDHDIAELVAHELGHWRLDASIRTKISSLAELKGVEGSPGVIYVEAYGARERQELQANVFARELLLPRSIAKALFAAGTGPREAARNLGLPLRLVRQQMIDAILLPMAADSPPKTLHEPSPDQKRAAHAKERFANVVAGPGTGKTSTLIHRVKHLVEDRKIDPSQILVVTFTNKAAFELVERLKAAGLERASEVWAGTFHAFGLDFLRKYHSAFGLPSTIRVADKLNQVTLLVRALPSLALKSYLRVANPYDWLGDVVKAITRLKEEMVSPGEYRVRLAKLSGVDPQLAARREDVATLYEAYEAALSAAGMVDFVDLVARPARFIATDRAKYSEFADRFRHVLVDEYQDVTEAMRELVRQLAHKKDVWVVGDVRQAIHHWRGASVRSLLNFEQTFKKEAATTRSRIRKFPLKINRRSTEELVALTTACGSHHVLQDKLPLDKMVSAQGKSGALPVLVSCSPDKVVPEALAAEISTYKSRGFHYFQQAILSRGGPQLELIAERLRERSIPVLYVGTLGQRAEIKTLLCLMQLLVERQPRVLIALNESLSLGLSAEDIADALRSSKSERLWRRGRWIKRTPPALNSRQKTAAAKLAHVMGSHTRYSTPWDYVCDLLLEARIVLPALSDESIEAYVVRLALWQFLQSLHVGDGDGKRPTLTRCLLRLEQRQRLEEATSRDVPPEVASLDAVRLLTVHGSKGLEYDVVHVAHVEKNSYGSEKPSWPPDDGVKELVPPEVLGSTAQTFAFEQAVERNNLLYVAVSRGKRQVLLYEDASRASKNRPVPLQHPGTLSPKPFTAAVQPTKAPISRPPPSLRTDPLPYDEFQTYARCPLQHWYRFTRQLPSGRTFDASEKARNSLMAALKDFSRGNVKDQEVAFRQHWDEWALPTEAEDRSLWRDARLVFDRGATAVLDGGGTFSELDGVIAGVPIRFPWGMLEKQGTQNILHVVALSDRQLTKYLRALLCGINPRVVCLGQVSNLLSSKAAQVAPNRNLTATDAYDAAVRYKAGDRSARPGTHCKYCAYQTVCPRQS